MPQLLAPLAHLLVRRQHTIHRAFGAEVLPGVEQRGVDLGRGEIHEARLMQHGENRAALARAERAGRGTPRRRSALGPPPAVVGRARQPERRTRGGDAQPRSDLGDRCHHEGSVVSGVPSNAATCFCRATRASARSARFCHRLISRACSASFLSRGSTTRRAGPRGFAAPASSPRSRAARHVVRCEEYSPSRRNNAPTAPGVLQPSASRTIFRLYSTVNCRRVALATTSIAGPRRLKRKPPSVAQEAPSSWRSLFALLPVVSRHAGASGSKLCRLLLQTDELSNACRGRSSPMAGKQAAKRRAPTLAVQDL